MRKLWIVTIIFSLIIGISFTSIDAQEKYVIPSWVKGVAGFWAEDKITDQDFGDALTFLITENILKIPESHMTGIPSSDEILLSEENSQLQNKIPQLENQILQLQNDILKLEKDKELLQRDNSELRNKISQLENEISILKENTDVETTTPSSLTVTTDMYRAYKSGEPIKITGKIVNIEGVGVSLKIINLNGDMIHSEGLSPRSDGSFSTVFVMNDPPFDEFGQYIVKVKYGSVEAKTNFWYDPH